MNPTERLSQFFKGVSFGSPVTQIARTGKERFNIAFRYVRGGAE